MEQLIAITLVVSVVILAGIMMTNLFGNMVAKLLPLMKSTGSLLEQNGGEVESRDAGESQIQPVKRERTGFAGLKSVEISIH